MIDETCNGYKNRATWNIALWLENDETLYTEAVDYARKRHNHGFKATYRGFIAWASLYNARTPDGYKFDSCRIDYKALSGLIDELDK